MISWPASEPGVIARFDLDATDPEPADCLPPGESPIAVVALSPGWIAVTERELLSYHPNRDRSLRRTPRVNVTGMAVRRAGAETFLRYAPGAMLYALVALGVGVLMLSISPEQVLTVPTAPGAGGFETIIQTLAWATQLLGAVLLFSGILFGLAAIVVVGYWFFSREVVVVFERGAADPIKCPADRHTGNRALRTLRAVLLDGSDSSKRP